MQYSMDLLNMLDRAVNPRKKHKWTEFYSSEEELIKELSEVDVELNKIVTEQKMYAFYKGYEFIHSFALQLQNGKTLSPKQITQAKRLAGEIRKANIVTKHIKEYL